MSTPKNLLTLAEAVDATGWPEEELRQRLGSDLVRKRSGAPAEPLVATWELEAIGALELPLSRHEREITRAIEYLKRNPGRLVATRDVATASNLNEKATAIVLQTLRMLGLVRRSRGPAPGRGGRRANRWQWIGPVEAAAHS